MNRRNLFWVLYAVLAVGITLGVLWVIGKGPGALLIWLGFLWFFSGLPSTEWWPGPAWPWDRWLRSSPFAPLMGIEMAVTGIVYHFTDSIFLAGATFVLLPALLVFVLMAGDELVHPWRIPAHRRELREERNKAARQDAAKRARARSEWKLPSDHWERHRSN